MSPFHAEIYYSFCFCCRHLESPVQCNNSMLLTRRFSQRLHTCISPCSPRFPAQKKGRDGTVFLRPMWNYIVGARIPSDQSSENDRLRHFLDNDLLSYVCKCLTSVWVSSADGLPSHPAASHQILEKQRSGW